MPCRHLTLGRCSLGVEMASETCSTYDYVEGINQCKYFDLRDVDILENERREKILEEEKDEGV